MKLDRIAAIAEIVSSVAIVVTLGYLAVQTKQNTAALVSSSRQQSLDAELGLLYKLMDHAEEGITPGRAHGRRRSARPGHGRRHQNQGAPVAPISRWPFG